MSNLYKWILLSATFGITMVVSACTTSQSVSPLVSTVASSKTAVPLIPTNSPTLTATALPTPLPVTATAEPTITPTDTPAATWSPEPTPSATITPTRVSTINLSACATIWEPGIYTLVSNIKTIGYDCFYVQSHNVVLDCNGHTIEGGNYNGHGIFIRKWGFPFQETPTNVEVRNCKVLHHRTGIFVGGGNNIYLHHNDVSNNLDTVDKQRFGAFLGLTEGGGIRLDTVKGGRAEYNTANNEAIGIDIRDSDHIVVQHNTAAGNSAWGISLLNTSYSQVSNNAVRDNIRYCAWGDGTIGRGCDAGAIILHDGASHNVVSENIISGDNGNGIFIKAHGSRCGDDNLIQNNKITDAVYNGIEFSFCTGNRVIGNEITGSYDAVWFGFSFNTEIRNNVIRNMNNHGIISYNSQNSIVADNQITNSREGIYFYWEGWDPKRFYFLTPTPDNFASRNNMITNNTLRDNNVAGIHLSNSVQNRLTGNTFVNNPKTIWLEGKTDGTVTSNGP